MYYAYGTGTPEYGKYATICRTETVPVGSYMVIASLTGLVGTNDIISCAMTPSVSESLFNRYGVSTVRTTGYAGGGCVMTNIIELQVESRFNIVTYGYSKNTSVECEGHVVAIMMSSKNIYQKS